MSTSMHYGGIWMEPYGFYVATWHDGTTTPFTIRLCNGAMVAWGFSIYRNSPGYRTLGISLRSLIDRNPASVAIDRDRTKDPRPKRAPKVETVTLPAAEIARLRKIEEMARQAYTADAIHEWFDSEGDGLAAALAVPAVAG
jgi:hypothetical protein